MRKRDQSEEILKREEEAKKRLAIVTKQKRDDIARREVIIEMKRYLCIDFKHCPQYFSRGRVHYHRYSTVNGHILPAIVHYPHPFWHQMVPLKSTQDVTVYLKNSTVLENKLQI